MQTMYQFIGLVVTLAIAIISGAITGRLMNLLNEKFMPNMQKRPGIIRIVSQ